MRTRAGARVSSVVLFALGFAIVFAVPAQFSLAKATSTTALDGLRVAGPRLVDERGNSIVLHGVDISGTEFACAQGGAAGDVGWSIFGGQPEDTAGTIEAMRSWHINAVRVPLNEDCWLGLNGINPKFGGAKYRSAILKFVTDLNGAGMYVIVDLHWSAPGNAVALSQQPMADENHGPAFWGSVASVFAGHPGVVFDLYNEPFLYGSYFQDRNQDSWSCWLSGCDLNQYLTGGHPYTLSYSWRTAGMQQLINAVRATGASNVVIANGLNWANDDSGWLAHRPIDPLSNLAAGWHEYRGERCSAVLCWAQIMAPIAETVPVVVGETGDYAGKGCSLANLPTFLPWADSHAVSYLAWTFNPWLYTHDVLIADWQGTPSACEGQYYAAHLAALAANPGIGSSDGPSSAKAPVSAPLDNGRPHMFYFVPLLVGLVLFGWGLALATNVIASTTRIPLGSLRSNKSSVGVGLAVCGAILFLFAALVIYQSPLPLR